MKPRGAIHSPKRARQLHDFQGLSIGTITPTDIDGLIEYHGVAFVLFEIKYAGAPLMGGQEIMVPRLTDAIAKSMKAIFLVADHEVSDPSESVNAAACIVRTSYTGGQWSQTRNGWTLRRAIWHFLELQDGADEIEVTAVRADRIGPQIDLAPLAERRPTGCVHKPEFLINGRCWVCDRMAGRSLG